jgi:RHS repeat-associated protein
MSAYSERSGALYREIWLISDHLGTPRMIAKRTGKLEGITRSDYLPFGESANQLGGRAATQGYVNESVRQGFTGYEEDAETGLDYAQARYYADGQGRFTAVDPLMASANPANPQTFNRYSYALNNPLRYTDPTGLISESDYDGTTEKEKMQQGPRPRQVFEDTAPNELDNLQLPTPPPNGTPVPGSEDVNFNCMAWGLGIETL